MRPGGSIITLDDIMDDPDGVATRLVESRQIYGLTDMDLVVDGRGIRSFRLTLEPWAPCAAEGFPTEHVIITITEDGQIQAVPINGHRRLWYHRNPEGLLPRHPTDPYSFMRSLPSLCLWYPGDPSALRWSWRKGLVAYVTIVHRHVQAEEVWRRTDRWPAEDAPHGEINPPIRTPEMRAAAGLAA